MPSTSVRSKMYMVSLPASYTEDDVGKIENWSMNNCCRAAVANTDGEHAVWVAIREKTRSKGEWMRHVRGVFGALRVDARSLTGDKWLELCAEQEALEIIRAAGNTTSRDSSRRDETTHDTKHAIF